MGNDTTSPLRITHSGPIEGLETAVLRRGRVRFPGLRLGTARTGPILCSRAMLAALRQAEGEGDAAIRLGHLLIGRWVLSVSRGGQTARQGVFGFLLCNLLLGLAILVPAMALGEVIAAVIGRPPNTVQWPFMLTGAFWMAVVGMNYAAWFGFPRRPG